MLRIIILLFFMYPFANILAEENIDINTYLATGQIQIGINKTKNLLDHVHILRPAKQDQLLFTLGVLEFFEAIEELGQNWYHYGLDINRNEITNIVPFLRMPVPLNPDPESINYKKFRDVLETLLIKLTTAEKTLGQIKNHTDIKLPIYMGKISLDFNNNGQIEAEESFGQIFQTIMGVTVDETTQTMVTNFYIAFDQGDIYWLRAYLHVLSALLEVYLAYDSQALFESTAHLYFLKPETPYPFLLDHHFDYLQNPKVILDLIAWIHLINFPLAEAQRMENALEHLQKAIPLSRQAWEFYLAETDNEQEWIPNPQQQGVLNISLSQKMIDNWLEVLNEVEQILAGERLIPFWRGQEAMGVNINTVFKQPTDFDLIMWIQGTDAAPYLEKGKTTQGSFWNTINRLFNRNLLGFAIWFN